MLARMTIPAHMTITPKAGARGKVCSTSAKNESRRVQPSASPGTGCSVNQERGEAGQVRDWEGYQLNGERCQKPHRPSITVRSVWRTSASNYATHSARCGTGLMSGTMKAVERRG
jgi:hypothetical protein